jgi:hypothetical protein
MLELLYIIIGATLFCGIFRASKTILYNTKNKNYIIEDDRDTDEKRIAGEDTSEIALNYLKKL